MFQKKENYQALDKEHRKVLGWHRTLTDEYRKLLDWHQTLTDEYRKLLDWHRTLTDEYRKLLDWHRTLTDEYRNLLDWHRTLEHDKRNADAQSDALRKELELSRSKYVNALKNSDLFLVGRILIEAPYPTISHHVREALASEQYESVELYLGSKMVRPGDTVLDLGSGLGLSAITAAVSTQGGRVVGYEADPRIADLAQRNAKRNHTNIEIRSSAISTEAGRFTFYEAPDFLSSSAILFEGGIPITVECAAIETVIDEIQPTVITCDIEGSERDLFEDVDLSGVKRMVVETHEPRIGAEGVKKCIQNLEAQGLKKVNALCWGPVLVFNREGMTEEIPPFTIKPDHSR